MPAFDIPDVGRIAMVTDPQGVPFYVMKPTPPAGNEDKVSDVFSPDQPGRVSWNELATRDLEAAKRFYRDQFGWTRGDVMPMGDMGDYQFIDHHGVRIGAMMTARCRATSRAGAITSGVADDRCRQAGGRSRRRHGDPRPAGSAGRRPHPDRHRSAGRGIRASSASNQEGATSWPDKLDHLPVVRQRRGAQGGRILRVRLSPTAMSARRMAPHPTIPAAHKGDELTVEFTVLGRPFVGLNGGPNFKPNEAVSFMVADRGPGGNRPLLGCDHQERRRGKRVRLVQGQMGLFLADHAARAARGDDRPRPGGGQARVRSDDDDAQDRHRQDRGRASPAKRSMRKLDRRRVPVPRRRDAGAGRPGRGPDRRLSLRRLAAAVWDEGIEGRSVSVIGARIRPAARQAHLRHLRRLLAEQPATMPIGEQFSASTNMC